MPIKFEGDLSSNSGQLQVVNDHDQVVVSDQFSPWEVGIFEWVGRSTIHKP